MAQGVTIEMLNACLEFYNSDALFEDPDEFILRLLEIAMEHVPSALKSFVDLQKEYLQVTQELSHAKDKIAELTDMVINRDTALKQQLDTMATIKELNSKLQIRVEYWKKVQLDNEERLNKKEKDLKYWKDQLHVVQGIAGERALVNQNLQDALTVTKNKLVLMTQAQNITNGRLKNLEGALEMVAQKHKTEVAVLKLAGADMTRQRDELRAELALVAEDLNQTDQVLERVQALIEKITILESEDGPTESL